MPWALNIPLGAVLTAWRQTATLASDLERVALIYREMVVFRGNNLEFYCSYTVRTTWEKLESPVGAGYCSVACSPIRESWSVSAGVPAAWVCGEPVPRGSARPAVPPPACRGEAGACMDPPNRSHREANNVQPSLCGWNTQENSFSSWCSFSLSVGKENLPTPTGGLLLLYSKEFSQNSL